MAFSAGQLLTAQLLNALLNNNSGIASVAAAESTASTTYVDLTTVGPSVTLTSAGNRALLIWTASQFTNTAVTVGHYSSIAVSGATTIAASDSISLRTTHDNSGSGFRAAQFAFLTITPGSNTYKMQYRCSVATSSQFSVRSLWVFAP